MKKCKGYFLKELGVQDLTSDPLGQDTENLVIQTATNRGVFFFIPLNIGYVLRGVVYLKSEYNIE